MEVKTTTNPMQIPLLIRAAKPIIISAADKSKYFDKIGEVSQVRQSDFVKEMIRSEKQVIFSCKGVDGFYYMRYIIEGEPSAKRLALKLDIKNNRVSTFACN